MINIHSFLEKYRGCEIWFKPNPGNGGDALIAYSAYRLFEKFGIKYRLVETNSDLRDKTVFFGGGGNLVEYYHHCADFIKAHHKELKALIILPHTVNGHSQLLSELGSNVTIICREQKSFDYVSSFKNIGSVWMADDLVFGLPIKEIFQNKKPAKRLITLMKPRTIASSVLRGRRKAGFFLKNNAQSNELIAFREDVEKTDVDEVKGNIDITALVNLNPLMDDYLLVEETCNRIISFLDQFQVINTNRLHVCIAGAILGKTVNFYGNSYHKNESVYNYSIKGKYPNVHWKGVA